MQCLATIIVIALPAFNTASEEPFEKALLPYLKNHCERCHNAEKQSGAFRIDKLSKNVGRENNPSGLR